MKVSGVRLMELYEKNNFSRVKFAGAVGVHEKTVRRWESGADVKEKYLKRICEVLGVVPADLKEDRVLVVGKGKKKIPIIRLPGSLGEVIDYMVYDIANVSMIVIADSSMEPLIENGEHVFIEEANEPENGSVMLVEVEGQLHLRECRRVKDGHIYIPSNPSKESFTDCKIVGRAISRTVKL